MNKHTKQAQQWVNENWEDKRESEFADSCKITAYLVFAVGAIVILDAIVSDISKWFML